MFYIKLDVLKLKANVHQGLWYIQILYINNIYHPLLKLLIPYCIIDKSLSK